MSFIWPWMLSSLLLIPLSILGFWFLRRARKRETAQLGALGILEGRDSLPHNRHRNTPYLIFLAGISVLLFSTARPEMVLTLPEIEGVVMLAFDVSASMGADDVEPTRMEAAKVAARAFIEERPENIKIGVVSFSDGGLVVQPPTDDEAMLEATIARLVPQSGTSIGRGILAALNQIVPETEGEGTEAEINQSEPSAAPVASGTFLPGIIVVLTDGENTSEPDPIEVAQVAISQGVRVFTVGIGTLNGTALEIEGFNVFTQLNEGVLKEIALLSEGEYFQAESAEDLISVYEDVEAQFVVKPQKIEITALLAGLGILVFLIGGTLSLLWFGRIA